MEKAIRETANDVLGESKGARPEGKETWWWGSDVQEAVKAKKVAYKEWRKLQTKECFEEYKKRKHLAKRVVAKAKQDAKRKTYDLLDTNEGERQVYNIARGRAQVAQYIGSIKFVKDATGKLLTKNEDVEKRWADYFEKLMNEETPHETWDSRRSEVEGHMGAITEEEVDEALRGMKKRKAVGPNDIPSDALKVIGKDVTKCIMILFNKIANGAPMPDEWRCSILVPLFKNKGDAMVCGNYRGVKLLCHCFKLWERIWDRRLRGIIQVAERQFGFMPGRSTTDAIHCLRRLMEKARERKSPLCLVFMDLEKAFDRVPHELIWWVLRRRKVPEGVVAVLQDMYKGTKTLVRTQCGDSAEFEVKVGVHQGSALSPFLFITVMDVLTEMIEGQPPWTMLFADDLLLAATTKEELEKRLERWRAALENAGLRISRSKTEFMKLFTQVEGPVMMDGVALPEVVDFKYLGSVVANDVSMEPEIKSRLSKGWQKWRSLTGVLCDKNMPIKLKGKVHRTVVRPVMMYSSETWALRKKDENTLDTAEMKMLRWITGVTKMDKIKNEVTRGKMKVRKISEKITEGRLRWFGHVERRGPEYCAKLTDDVNLEGKRQRGRSSLRRNDKIKEDLKRLGASKEEALNRKKWRETICMADSK